MSSRRGRIQCAAKVLAVAATVAMAGIGPVAVAAQSLQFSTSSAAAGTRWDYSYDQYSGTFSVTESDYADQHGFSTSCASAGCNIARQVSSINSVSATAQSQADGSQLRAQSWSSSYELEPTFDSQKADASAQAGWSDQWLIAPTANHAAGSFGRIQVQLQMEGSFPDQSGNGGSIGGDPIDGGNYPGTAVLSANSGFVDSYGQTHSASITVSPTWTELSGVATGSAYVTFQYGTDFNMNLNLAVDALSSSPYGSSGTPFLAPTVMAADFFSAGGGITEILVPIGTTLQSGALQAGEASYGSDVFGSTDPNLYVQSVPEPDAWMLMGLGLVVIGGCRSRKNDKSVKR